MGGIKNVWGAAGVGSAPFETQEQLDEVYKLLKEGDVDTIDTATLYGASEETLGKLEAPKQFKIDTKTVGGFHEGGGKKETIISQGEQSQKYLGNVDIWYIHSPDDKVPLEETVEGINEMHKRGFFKRFGLSNFKPAMVEKVYEIAKAKGYVLPTVYQGNFNPAARKIEEDLLPVLRKLNISFYAYSPLAGGFLTKTKEDIESGKGRFDTSNFLGQMYSGLYARPALLEALTEWANIAEEEGVTKAELAYRWVKYNSALKPEHGDAIIIGSSSAKQLKQTLDAVKKGPLSDKAVKRIDHFWETIKHAAPLDNFHQ